jgi:DNA-binding transcriptional ArsR family regulator
MDLGTARALANPLRRRILRELESAGEATATTLAQRLGVTTGGTSYNLRVLATHGLVAEVPERSVRGQRWWRPVGHDLRLPPRGAASPELRAALDELDQAWLLEDLERFSRFHHTRTAQGDWADAVPYSRGSIQVTRAELAEFFESYLALLRRYQRPPGAMPLDARTVQARFIAFPDPDVPS